MRMLMLVDSQTFMWLSSFAAIHMSSDPYVSHGSIEVAMLDMQHAIML